MLISTTDPDKILKKRLRNVCMREQWMLKTCERKKYISSIPTRGSATAIDGCVIKMVTKDMKTRKEAGSSK